MNWEDGSQCHILRHIVGNSRNHQAPIFFLIHGAGHSLESWTCFIEESEQLFPVGSEFIAYDLYGHGQYNSNVLLVSTNY